ncbi:MAG: N-acetyltransferase [Candidatus Omnitrophica bacterium]|nr:N-acetyltransferase [Candidatus Omnitrophota bacterium]
MKTKKYHSHASAIVGKGATVGTGTRIWHFSHVMDGARVGKDCNIGQNVFLAKTARIGNRVKIQNNVSVYDGVVLHDDVFCGPSCVFTNISTPRSAFPRKGEYLETHVMPNATIGANATIVCGVTIGSYALVGAGSVVTRDVGEHELVYGVPARRHGWVCACGEKLAFSAKMARCGRCRRGYWLDQKKKRINALHD